MNSRRSVQAAGDASVASLLAIIPSVNSRGTVVNRFRVPSATLAKFTAEFPARFTGGPILVHRSSPQSESSSPLVPGAESRRCAGRMPGYFVIEKLTGFEIDEIPSGAMGLKVTNAV